MCIRDRIISMNRDKLMEAQIAGLVMGRISDHSEYAFLQDYNACLLISLDKYKELARNSTNEEQQEYKSIMLNISNQIVNTYARGYSCLLYTSFCYDKYFPYWSEFDLTPPGQPGEEVGVYDADFGKIGFAICYDVNFPEVWEMLAAGCLLYTSTVIMGLNSEIQNSEVQKYRRGKNG